MTHGQAAIALRVAGLFFLDEDIEESFGIGSGAGEGVRQPDRNRKTVVARNVPEGPWVSDTQVGRGLDDHSAAEEAGQINGNDAVGYGNARREVARRIGRG